MTKPDYTKARYYDQEKMMGYLKKCDFHGGREEVTQFIKNNQRYESVAIVQKSGHCFCVFFGGKRELVPDYVIKIPIESFVKGKLAEDE